MDKHWENQLVFTYLLDRDLHNAKLYRHFEQLNPGVHFFKQSRNFSKLSKQTKRFHVSAFKVAEHSFEGGQR